MTRAKNRKCPKCGEMFSSQGLAGHLRWVHQLDAATIRDVLDGVPLPPESPPKEPPQGQPQHLGGHPQDGTEPALPVLIAGLAVLAAIIIAKYAEGRAQRAAQEQRAGDVAYCARCKQALDIAEARRKRVSVVQCPKCGQLNALPPLNGGAQGVPPPQIGAPSGT